MDKREKVWLLVIIGAVLTLRFVLAFTLPTFTYESYFHLRQVGHITEQGFPLYEDDLSYGGRTNRFLPFFHYFMAAFALFLPLEIVAKIIPNILLATLPLLVYLIGTKITTNSRGPLYSALIAGFLPILYDTNDFAVKTLFIPLVFLTIYAFMRINDKNFLQIYLISFLLLSLTSFSTFLLLMGFGIYLLLSVIERKKIEKAEVELIIFSVFFFVWVQFLFFKDIFITEGFSFIWQNVPLQVIADYFPKVSVTEALFFVSIIPFLAGIYVVYRSLFELKNQRAFLLISLTISTTILAWLRFIKFELSLAFFGVILAILFALFYEEATNYIKKTKFPHWQRSFSIILVILLLLTTAFPAGQQGLQQETPTQEEITAFRWISENLPRDATVLALLEEGHLVTYLGEKQNMMDEQFSLIRNVEQRFKDLGLLYTTPFQTQAFDLLGKYGIDYIVFTPRAQEKYKVSNFPYLTPECFQRVYKVETKIYEVTCALTETKVTHK